MIPPDLKFAPLRHYGIAVGAVLVVLGLRILLAPHTGPESPFLLFMGAVMLAAAYGGLGPGLVSTVFAAACSEFFLMQPAFRFEVRPDQAFRVLLFLGEGVFVSVICAMLKSARRRAEASAAEARALEREVVEISDHEQRRIGHDLHDGLGQHLTGIAFIGRLLGRRLAARGAAEAEDARRIEELMQKAIAWTRDLAAGLAPVEARAEGLPDALRELALNAEEIFKVPCAFRLSLPPGDTRAALPEPAAATHVYRIAQEAVSNAIRHGRASHVWIGLSAEPGRCVLTVRDDGVGVPERAAREGASDGMGLKTMAYRSRIIGGSLDVRRGEDGGTVVTCTLPVGPGTGVDDTRADVRTIHDPGLRKPPPDAAADRGPHDHVQVTHVEES